MKTIFTMVLNWLRGIRSYSRSINPEQGKMDIYGELRDLRKRMGDLESGGKGNADIRSIVDAIESLKKYIDTKIDMINLELTEKINQKEFIVYSTPVQEVIHEKTIKPTVIENVGDGPVYRHVPSAKEAYIDEDDVEFIPNIETTSTIRTKVGETTTLTSDGIDDIMSKLDNIELGR